MDVAAEAGELDTDAYGHWGPPTGDYNFCEVDYAITYYLAEFFSAMSSIPIALYGVYYLRQTALHGHGWKIALSSVGVIIIGVGSFAFHGTMLREGQMLDELPMLWSAVFFLFTALTLGEPPNSTKSNLIGLGLMTYAIVNSIVYFTGGFVYFILAYIFAVLCVFASTARHMLLPENKEHHLMRSFALRAMGFYAGGFVLFWLPEQILCGNQNLPHHERGPIQSLADLPVSKVQEGTSVHFLSSTQCIFFYRSWQVPLHAFFHFTSALGYIRH